MIKRMFRLDIQGLRAIAVLSVVIFHIDPLKLPGGFIGVDMFFVISGYLIMGHIWKELQNETFNLVDFYSKRAKRLFPPLFFTLSASLFIAYFLMLPEEFSNFCNSLISSLLYVSNIWFYTKSGYFDYEMQLAPLLHTWSLSVEEQFYIVIPLILIMCFRKKANILVALSLMFFLSLTLSEMLLHLDESLSFYASPSRFWQFIAGGLVSISVVKSIDTRWIREVLVLTSLSILCVCMFLMSPANFPGLKALIPTLATLIIIYCCKPSDISHLILSNPVALFFGNISYSLYLWHWPVIIFYKISLGGNLQLSDKIIVLIISIILGYLSYHFIENKVISIDLETKYFNPILMSLIATVVISIVAFVVAKENYKQYTPEQLLFESYLSYPATEYRRGSCFIENSSTAYNEKKCVEASVHKKNILLIGDSHAAHWYGALKSNLKNTESLTQVTSSSCKPFIHQNRAEPSNKATQCRDLMNWTFSSLLKEHNFDQIIISARWLKSDVPHLMETIEFLQERTNNISVLGPVIEYKVSLPRLLAKSTSKDKIRSKSYLLKMKEIDSLLAKKLKSTEVEYFSVIDSICSDDKPCETTTPEGIPLQFDYGHLTLKGAEFILNKLHFGKP